MIVLLYCTKRRGCDGTRKHFPRTAHRHLRTREIYICDKSICITNAGCTCSPGTTTKPRSDHSQGGGTPAGPW